MKEEDGINAGGRNIGRLALFLIPLALGLGASVWLGVWIGAHQYRHERSQEDRAANYVGAAERPKSKVAIEIYAHDCTHITRSDIDGSRLVLYARNDCHVELDYLAWHWQQISPDGTVLKEGMHNSAYCPIPRSPGTSAECSFDIEPDDRMKTLRIWTSKTTG